MSIKRDTVVKSIVFLVGAFLIVWLVASLSGCAETKAKYIQDVRIIDPVTGKEVYRRTTDTRAFARAPDNASAPTTQSVSAEGVNTAIAPVHTKTAEQIVAENGIVFYWLAGIFAAATVASFAVLKSPPLGIGFGIAAGACALAPRYIEEIGPALPIIGGVALLFGAVWFLAKRHASNRASVIGGARLGEADALGKQGKYVQALDAMRSGIDVLSAGKPVLAKEVQTTQAALSPVS